MESPEQTSDLEMEISPVKLPGSDVNELVKFRNSDEGKRLAAWCKEQFNQAREQRTQTQHQWYINIRMVWGQQYLKDEKTSFGTRVVPQKVPSYVRKKTRNLLRPFVRRECSKFMSTFPNVIAVPSTGEEEDVRAAYAAEQAWESMKETRQLKRTFSRAVWWMVLTGNGFLKQWWDPSCLVPGADPGTVSRGDIKFESVSPFHIFVPDLMEREIDDQPFVIQAQTKTVDWVRAYYKDELAGVPLQSSEEGGNVGLLDTQYRVITGAPDSKANKVVVYEYWIKKGATELLPDGGLVIMVDDTMVMYSPVFPYKHGQFPFTKLEHIPTDNFYALSPLVDLIEPQKEYNEVATDISMSAKRMGRPQLMAYEGSIVTSKMTNEPGSIIGVRPGFQMPTPMPLMSLPQYVTDQQDRIRADFEDISGQHEISQGQAPSGVSAGTALSLLKETDDAFLVVQYQNIEQGVERTAVQSLSLFNEFVDSPRKLKMIGKDQSFDVLMLQGSDIASGLDVRVEQGSSMGESKAAREARYLEMFQMGAIDQQTYLRLVELGGAQRALDTLNVAARKAQRENLKMKSLELDAIQQQTQGFVSKVLQDAAQNGLLQQMADEGLSAEDIIQTISAGAPALVAVDDFDIHEIHLEEHNRYRMSQEYETLPDEIKQEFQKHVAEHEQYLQQAIAMQMLMQGGGGMGADPAAIEAGGGETPGPEPMPDTMSATAPTA